MTSLTARWHRSINEVPEQQWNSMVGDAAIPFYRWSWLAVSYTHLTLPTMS